jgi:hypothetical protein
MGRAVGISKCWTEKDAFADILHWSLNRPVWQRDDLRRLVLTETISPSEIEELVAICLDPKASSSPPASNHLKSERVSGEAISLIRIENPAGINTLARDRERHC